MAKELERIPEFNQLIFSYGDDLLIAADSEEQLSRLFAWLLEVLDQCKLLINPKKTKIGVRKLDIFGFTVSPAGMCPSESAVPSKVWYIFSMSKEGGEVHDPHL